MALVEKEESSCARESPIPPPLRSTQKRTSATPFITKGEEEAGDDDLGLLIIMSDRVH